MADNLQPTTEDLARDAAADLAVCESATPGPWHRETFPLDGKYGRSEYHEVTQGPANDASQRFCLTDDLLAKDGDFIALARTALPAWIHRAVVAEVEASRLRDLIDNHDTISPCACCGKKLAWVFAGDGTYNHEVDTGNTHACPISMDDFRAGKFPEGTYRYQEHRAIEAEARIKQLENTYNEVIAMLQTQLESRKP